MRVVQLLTQTQGGPVDHAVDLAAGLVERGHESHVIGPPGPWTEAVERRGGHVHLAGMRHKLDATGARDVAAAITRERPDVLHLQDRRAGLVGRVVAARRSIPVVYTLHGVPDPMAALVPGNLAVAPARMTDGVSYLRLERALARAPRSVVVTPCEAVADYVRDHVGVPPERVVAVHNGVPPQWLADRRAGPEPSAVVRVVWLGLMQPVKRVPDLVRAAASVPGLELGLVGDGPERGAVEAVVAQVGGERWVRFLGFQRDPAPFLRAADIFVLPSAAEACPMALLQAMACGVPVIASRAGGIPEIVRDGVDGVLVDAGDVGQLAAALARLAADPGLRARLGASGRARVASLFTLDRTVTRLLGVYEEVAARAPDRLAAPLTRGGRS